MFGGPWGRAPIGPAAGSRAHPRRRLRRPRPGSIAPGRRQRPPAEPWWRTASAAITGSVPAEAMARLGNRRRLYPVIAYDDTAGSIAARLWWMLSVLDHPRGPCSTAASSRGREGWRAGRRRRARPPTSPKNRGRPKLSSTGGCRRRTLAPHRCPRPRRYRGELEPVDAARPHPRSGECAVGGKCRRVGTVPAARTTGCSLRIGQRRGSRRVLRFGRHGPPRRPRHALGRPPSTPSVPGFLVRLERRSGPTGRDHQVRVQ